ncbi:MAG: MBL fold metallo-hydrolase [Acidobacteria bacterium]|nr:MBL fold metallo-hydrolase [Acidobacteriota bacterium]MCI0621353.1 MBL fold metallo-hydrolase [Acidobacteriota bacterium]MCI0720100.1 MBL fold metallo-hydrolase [Acidobacteriota bacterium]
MRRAQLLMSTGLMLVMATLWIAAWKTAVEATPGNVKQIAPGVWFREGEIKDKGHCNNIWIEMKDYLIVVDANFPSGAEACLADIKKTSQKPVKYVFDTHHHGDHAYGNPVWTKLGATTLAYVGVAEEMKRYEPKRWQDSAKGRKDVSALNLSTAEPPKQTFKEKQFVLEDGARRVEFHFFGWAHTRGDGFVYLPKESIICTGDAVVNGPFNYMGDGNSANWPNVIDQVKKLKVSTILPGHGIPGGSEVLDGQRQFFVELRKTVGEAVKSGKKLEDLVAKKDDKPATTSLHLPASVKNWTGDFLAGQVEVVYKEMTQNKPHGEILGGK